MGFIKSNHTIEKLGLTLPTAYARIINIHVDKDGRAYGTLAIQQSREDVGTLRPLDQVTIDVQIDKTAPIFEQLYLKAKEEQFADWEDDIVEEEPVVEGEEGTDEEPVEE